MAFKASHQLISIPTKKTIYVLTYVLVGLQLKKRCSIMINYNLLSCLKLLQMVHTTDGGEEIISAGHKRSSAFLPNQNWF